MVSALIAAAAEGRREHVLAILDENTTIDINGKDEQGLIAIVEAVKNGYVEVVRVLIERGADPTVALEHTQDPAMHEILTHGGNYPEQKPFYPPGHSPVGGPAGYPYYQPQPLPDGAVFYPPPPHDPSHHSSSAGGPGNLPPPEVARMIPCRYFPACRYGTSCMFAHPQGPYFQGPLPPAQYHAHYDPMNPQNYPQNYYPMSPPAFQPPPPANGVPMNSLPSSPPPPMTQGPPSSDMNTPPAPFSSNGLPGQLPYPPMGPSHYPPHPTQTGGLPMGAPPMPVYHQPPPPQSPSAMYNGAPNGVPPPAPFVIHHNVPPSFPAPVPVQYPDTNGPIGLKSPPLNPQPDSFSPSGPAARDGFAPRRGGVRRGSFGGGRSNKPPCLFYPAGKCKNGDDCRFPHILNDSPAVASQQYFNGRGGAPRAPRAHLNGASGSPGSLEQKMSNMAVRDVPRPQNGHEINGKMDRRYGYKNGPSNGAQQVNGKRPVSLKQRLPNADDFPVLSGSLTPPTTKSVNGYFNGQSGPTAAQILQAPAPARSTSSNATRTASPDSTTSQREFGPSEPPSKAQAPQIPLETAKPAPVPKLPISFAAITASAPANNLPETAVEVSVSA